MSNNLESNGALALSEYDKKAVGKRIRKLRLECDLSQEEFAESIDVCTTFISELENGKKGMAIQTLCCLCAKYRQSADYILFGSQYDTLCAASIEQAFQSLPTNDLPDVIQYLQSLYKIRQLNDTSIFKR